MRRASYAEHNPYAPTPKTDATLNAVIRAFYRNNPHYPDTCEDVHAGQSHEDYRAERRARIAAMYPPPPSAASVNRVHESRYEPPSCSWAEILAARTDMLAGR